MLQDKADPATSVPTRRYDSGATVALVLPEATYLADGRTHHAVGYSLALTPSQLETLADAISDPHALHPRPTPQVTAYPAVPAPVVARVRAAGDTIRLEDTVVPASVAEKAVAEASVSTSKLLGVSYARATLPDYGTVTSDGGVDPNISDRRVLVVAVAGVTPAALEPGPAPAPGTTAMPSVTQAIQQVDLVAYRDADTGKFIDAATY